MEKFHHPNIEEIEKESHTSLSPEEKERVQGFVENREMYELPGNAQSEDPIRAVARYIKSERVLKEKLQTDPYYQTLDHRMNDTERGQAQSNLMLHGTTPQRIAIAHNLNQMSDPWRNQIVKNGFEDESSDVRQIVANMPNLLSADDKKNAIQIAIDDADIDTLKILSKFMRALPRDDTKQFIKQLLESDTSELNRIALANLDYLAPKEQYLAIKKILESSNKEARIDAIRQFSHIKNLDMLSPLMLDVANDPDQDIRAAAIENFYLFSHNPELTFLSDAFSSQFPDVKVATIPYIHKTQDRIEKTRDILNQGEEGLISAGIEYIELLPAPERKELIQRFIKSESSEVVVAALKVASFLNAQELVDAIKIGLSHQDESVKKQAAKAIYRLPNPEMINENQTEIVIMESLENLPYLNKETLDTLKYAMENKNSRISSKAKRVFSSLVQIDNIDTELLNDETVIEEMSHSKLYNNQKTNLSWKTPFDKTGSGITLLGSHPNHATLQDRAIIRHIKMKQFLEWKKLYENHTLWRNNNFDYVPIEPIMQFFPRLRQGVDMYQEKYGSEIDIYTSTLDTSLDKWQGKFKDELLHRAQEIRDILKEAHIIHGHANKGNFCLKFYRDENGNPDLSKCPRLYLIDFDQASSLYSP